MGLIKLKGISLKAPVGVYRDEKINGNEFLIDIAVTTDFVKAARNDDLDYTVDYEELYKIVSDVMQDSHNLLETAAYRIGKIVLKEFKRVKSVEISIEKLTPPISGKCASALVEYKLERT